MENLYKSIVMGLLVVVIWVFLRVLNWLWLRPKRLEKILRQQGLKGNFYKPLFGDLIEYARRVKDAKSRPISLSDDIVKRVTAFSYHCNQTHGKNYFMWFGPVPRINISDPEIVKEILSKNFKFTKPISNPLLKLLAPGLVDYEGEQWAKHRKIINPAFHIEKLKHMLPAICLSCNEMIVKWNTLLSAKDSSELDVHPYLEIMSSDIISRTAFGSNYEEGRNIFRLQKEQAQFVLQAASTIYIPGWRFLPTKTNKRMKDIDKQVQTSLWGIINKRMKAMEAGLTKVDDLLGILLDSNAKEIERHGNNKKIGMSIKEVIEECKLFYVAGQETTAALLTWTMVLLSQHHNWQQKAREEVMQIFGDQTPSFDGLNHLKIVTSILFETLRLYPPIAMMTRTVNEETKLGVLTIPSGVQLSLPIILIHHDREIWGDDVKEFKPERFFEGVSKATKKMVSYFPFGWGPRICIGQNFAILEARIALAMILQKFSFELSPSYSHAPYSKITVRPQYGAHLILHKV